MTNSNEQMNEAIDELAVDEVMEENEVSIAYDIAAYPSDLTLSVINEMYRNGDILIPDFQRNFVWTINQASLLVESFLLGLPVPQVFFHIDEQNKSLIIDGQQRILSVIFYLEGYFGLESLQGKRQVFRLSGLDDNSPFAKKRFTDLDESWQRKFKGSVLRAINIRQLNPKGHATSIYHIFERLNTGGTPLKPQEIRNCVYRGKFAQILKELNTDNNWRIILGKQTYDRHQKDVELILRIFSLGNNQWQEYEKPMKEWLNIAMHKEQAGDSPRMKKFISQFKEAADIIANQIGAKPFHVRGPLNSSALDSIFCIIMDNLKNLSGDLKSKYKTLLINEQFKQATYYGTSDASVLKQRFSTAKEQLAGK
jgi:hypothetical protein